MYYIYDNRQPRISIISKCACLDFEGENYDAALLEEQEALALQRKLAEEIQDDDLGMDIFKVCV